MTIKKQWGLVDLTMQDILGNLRLEGSNNGLVLEFDINGYWRIYNSQYGKTIKKYSTFRRAINYLLDNN